MVTFHNNTSNLTNSSALKIETSIVSIVRNDILRKRSFSVEILTTEQYFQIETSCRHLPGTHRNLTLVLVSLNTETVLVIF